MRYNKAIEDIIHSRDFIIHVVTGNFKDLMLSDMHTHGFQELLGTELQYVLPVERKYLNERSILIYQVADRLYDGRLSADSEETFTIPEWGDCLFRLHRTKDCTGKDIVRIIEGDMSGKFPGDAGCEAPFRWQDAFVYNYS